MLCCLGYADDNFKDKDKHQKRCNRIHTERGPDCSSERFLRQLDVAMKQTFIARPLEAISDSPIDFLFEKVLGLSSDALVIQSVRAPLIWAKKRVHYHARSEIICKRALWDSVPHPFDVVGCIRQSALVSDSLQTFPVFNKSLNANSSGSKSNTFYTLLADAYTQMNTYNAALVPEGRLHLVCMWDGNADNHTETHLRIQSELMSVWESYRGKNNSISRSRNKQPHLR